MESHRSHPKTSHPLLDAPPQDEVEYNPPSPPPASAAYAPPLLGRTATDGYDNDPIFSAAMRPSLLRAKSDYGPRARHDDPQPSDAAHLLSNISSALNPGIGDYFHLPPAVDQKWTLRHGFDLQLASEELSNLLNSQFFMYYTDKKHETGGIPRSGDVSGSLDWRMKDRLKTVSAVLVLCLHIGVDPPDVVKPKACANKECWVDPLTIKAATISQVPLNAIIKALQLQYEQLSMRSRYKCALDPTLDEMKKLAMGVRKNARNERVLFHYNGHGVPKPTEAGEIWVFNKSYTQYVPLPIEHLWSWTSGPTIYVWDCSAAGNILKNFRSFGCAINPLTGEPNLKEDRVHMIIDHDEYIHFAACAAHESLPTNPLLPADVFTSCLTTPIKMALHFFVLLNPLENNRSLVDISLIPGAVSERRSALGELNWIFTAITDSIAWDMLDKTTFKKLFRQDLMVAALFRNFLLAQRVMRKFHCHPMSHPEIMDCHNHPLWASWDLVVEGILAQIPDLALAATGEKYYEYQYSTFFAEQLTAFEVYLAQEASEKVIPKQLPALLQVLLSQSHRLRALILLSRFLDLGPWAVELALAIGIFPYILKLLQSQAAELKPVLIFLWARILAVDLSCQTDLLRDQGYVYFIRILDPQGEGIQGLPNITEHRAMCAFILAMICRDHPDAQLACIHTLHNDLNDVIACCVAHLGEQESPLLRQWACLCLGSLWAGNTHETKLKGINTLAHQKLYALALDCVAEVRVAMLYALTSILGIPGMTPKIVAVEESIAATVLTMASDGNTMVRKELLIFFSHFIARYEQKILVAAFEQLIDDYDSEFPSAEQSVRSRLEDPESATHISSNSIYSSIWREVLILSADPYPEIADMACQVVDATYDMLLDSPLGPHAAPFIEALVTQRRKSAAPTVVAPTPRRPGLRTTNMPSVLAEEPSLPVEPLPKPHKSRPPSPPALARADSKFASSLKRTASGVAMTLKNFALGISTPTEIARVPTGSSGNLLLPASRIDPMIEGLSAKDRRGHIATSKSSLLNPAIEGRIPMPRRYKPRKHVWEQPGEDGRKSKPLVLKSTFFDWAVEYFREPQMKPPEAEEHGSLDYNMRLWRRDRNERIITKTQPLKDTAGSSPWDKFKGSFNSSAQPTKICWHQFENHLVVADDKEGLLVWDWKQKHGLNHFNNGNPDRSRITQIRLINEDDQALLMAGSSDGVIKIYRDYDDPDRVELVTAIRALTDLETSTSSTGLVFEWQQSRGQILVAGDVRSIRVWNAGTETLVDDIRAQSKFAITSLTSDQVEGSLVIAGSGDGTLRLYDLRERPQARVVGTWREHKAWITNVHLQRGGQRELMSASRNGDVKLWDIRQNKSLRTIQAMPAVGGPFSGAGGSRVAAMHEHAPVFAVGAKGNRSIKLYNTGTSRELNHLELHGRGFLGMAGNGVSCLSFHPHRMLFAGGAVGDPHVSIYSCYTKPEVEL